MPARHNTVKAGELVAIEFDDHCENGPVTPFRVFGRVVAQDKHSIRVACWEYADAVFRDDDNERNYSIARAAITRIRKLK